MKKIIGACGAVVLAAVCAACASGTKEKEIDPDVEPVVLSGDSIAVDQILLPYSIVVKEDRALLRSRSTDTVFYAFSLPDFRFLYKTGVRGNGPDDFLEGNVLDFPDARRIVVDQMMQDRVDVFDFSDQGLRKVRSLANSRMYYRPRVMVNDSIAVVECYDWAAKTAGVYTYNFARGVVVDSLPEVQTWVKSIKMGREFSALVNMFHVFGYGEYFALPYYMMNRIEFYRVSPQGRIKPVKALGQERVDPALERYGRDAKGSVQDFDQIPLFVYFGVASPEHLFVANLHGMTPSERDERDREGTLGMSLDVYTWDGRLAGRIQLPVRGLFAVSEKYRRIYAIDPRRDFEYIYTYSYDFEK